MEGEVNWTSIWAVLAWIVSGTGAGWLAYWVMKWIKWDIAKSEIKRYVSYALSVVFAWVAWFGLVWAGQQMLPTTGQEWVERLFSLAIPAIITSQTLHAARELHANDVATLKAQHDMEIDKDVTNSCSCC